MRPIERTFDTEGMGEQRTEATILHVDMDAFFASVELVERPGLRGRPMVVGGRERGVVLAATYEARALGIRSGMPMARALARLPSLVVLPPDQQRYRAVSRHVMRLLAEVTPQLQQLSVDEAFLDVAGARRRLGSPVQIATDIRRRIRAETGLPASVGIASTLMLAKIASQRAKPDGVLEVPAEAGLAFLHSLEVGALWGVGEATTAALADLGVRTVGELAAIPLPTLSARLGPASAARLHALSWGRDERNVEPERLEKSISAEHTFATDVTDRGELERTLLAQAHTCAGRLRAAGMLTRGVTLKVRHADFTTLTRSSRLAVPSDVAQELYRAARTLLAGVSVQRPGIRLVGVRADDLTPTATTPLQTPLGTEETPSVRAVEQALDGLQRRFGTGAPQAATLLPRPEGRGVAASGVADRPVGLN